MPYRSYGDLITASLPPRMRDVVDSVHKNVVLVRPSGDDDSAAILKARDDVGGRGAIQLTPGVFNVSEFVGLPDNTALVGNGPSTLINFTKPINVGIGNIDSSNSRISVSNLRLDGADLCNDPIEFNNVTDGIVDSVWVTRGNHDAIEFESCTRCIVSNSIVDNSNSFDGIEFDSCVDCIAVGCLSHSNGQDGFNLSGTTDHCSVLSCYSFDNTRGGFLAAASTVRNTVFGYADSNMANYSDSGTNNLFQVMGGDRFDFSVGDILTARFRSGEAYFRAQDAVPADGNVPTSSIIFYLDETGNSLKVKAKYANGTTVVIGTLALI